MILGSLNFGSLLETPEDDTIPLPKHFGIIQEPWLVLFSNPLFLFYTSSCLCPVSSHHKEAAWFVLGGVHNQGILRLQKNLE